MVSKRNTAKTQLQDANRSRTIDFDNIESFVCQEAGHVFSFIPGHLQFTLRKDEGALVTMIKPKEIRITFDSAQNKQAVEITDYIASKIQTPVIRRRVNAGCLGCLGFFVLVFILFLVAVILDFMF